MTTECLDEETILAFCRGGIAKPLRPPIEAHLGECDECRALVSAVARSSLIDPKELMSDPAIAATTPAPGTYESPEGAAGSARSADRRVSGGGPASAPVREGDLLAGKYRVERVLGAGGMGVVVAARHTQLDQRVALKFLLPAACEAPGAIARFLREGKAAASIASEHVARVSDTGVLDNGSPYLVMEYLEGSDLGALVTSKGAMSPGDAIDYVLQASEAIVEAHALGIVHRDLKPANLFLAHRKDGSPLVKVLDFGISKSDGGSRSQLTSTSALMGSPRYMSPEQMVSARDVDARTDVWALGVILYELTTGHPVWEASTVQGLCALIASAPAPLLRQRAPHAPAILEDVIARCLAKSPSDRIASVADLAIALEPIAPESAKMSIDRILRVARRTRGDQPLSHPLPPAGPLPMIANATTLAMSSSTGSSSSSSSSRAVVLVIGGLIALLVIVGVVLNVMGRRDKTLTPPPEIAAPTTTPSASVSIAVTPDVPPPPVSLAASATTPPRAAQRAPKARPSSSAPTPPGDPPNRALSDRK